MSNMNLCKLILLFIGFIFCLPAHAQNQLTPGNFFFAPSAFYNSGLTARSSKEDKTYGAYDAKLAFQIYPLVYLGLTYQGDFQYKKTSGFSPDELNENSRSFRASWGPSVGYVTPTYHILFTYYFDSKFKVESTTSSSQGTYKYSGTGYQIDLGYKIQMLSVYWGPQLSYKAFNYNALSLNGAKAESISPNLWDSGIEPSLVLYYFF